MKNGEIDITIKISANKNDHKFHTTLVVKGQKKEITSDFTSYGYAKDIHSIEEHLKKCCETIVAMVETQKENIWE